MAPFSRGFLRIATLGCGIVALIFVSFFGQDRTVRYDGIWNRALASQQALSKRPSSAVEPTTRRLNLDEQECRSIFPGLFADIDVSVRRGRFMLGKSHPDYKGLVQGLIKNGNLYILTAASDTLPEILHQRTAVLAQIHRALITSPSPVPDTYFAFCINDTPKNNTWAFSRPNKESTYNTWLMPSFASWSWQKAHLGVMDDVLARIEHVERDVAWAEKADKVVWRGTVWFNPLGYPSLRKDLVKATKGKEWADVAALDGDGASNSISIEDFCRYRYVVYTEGVTYSGRLPFHQSCGSVLIMAPVTWLTTSALLLRPIVAEDLMAAFEDRRPSAASLPTQSTILPTVAAWEEANAIYVRPDFSDLETVVRFLRSHPEVGQRIARNQRETVVGGRYLGMPAETCYWRALMRGWAAVAEVDESQWSNEAGERYETWLLKEVSTRRESTRGRTGAR